MTTSRLPLDLARDRVLSPRIYVPVVHIFWHARPVCGFAEWPLPLGHRWVPIGTDDEAEATCLFCIDGVREGRGRWAGDVITHHDPGDEHVES